MARTVQRNHNRPQLPSPPAFDVGVGISKLCKDSHFFEMHEPLRRIHKVLWVVFITANITGMSTRKLDNHVNALGRQSDVSKRPCRGSARTSTRTSQTYVHAVWETSRSPTSGRMWRSPRFGNTGGSCPIPS